MEGIMNTIDLIKKHFKDVDIIGNQKELKINEALPIDCATENSIVWLKGTPDNTNQIFTDTLSKIIVCDKSLKISGKLLNEKTFILTTDPKNTFIKILGLLFPPKELSGIHSSAIITDSSIGKNTFIGPNVIVENSKIGDNCKLIGNIFIHSNTIINENVTINAGTTVGSDGFGYSRDPSTNKLHKFPHYGGVIIESNVEIGSNVCIDKGTLGNTVIQEGTKIDNLVHVAHNVNIGKNCLIIANTMVAGSVNIGDNSWIAPSANIINGISIGSNCTIGMGAVVTKNVPDNEVWTGSPARPIEEYKKQLKNIKKL
jgi:UDP-3-O-[3-hydroxymyristoyl] glucosamine N-acyltransferase